MACHGLQPLTSSSNMYAGMEAVVEAENSQKSIAWHRSEDFSHPYYTAQFMQLVQEVLPAACEGISCCVVEAMTGRCVLLPLPRDGNLTQ